MMPEPSSAPEGVDPEVEPEGDPKGDPDIDELFDRLDAASMEGAINKFMEGLEGQEHASQYDRGRPEKIYTIWAAD